MKIVYSSLRLESVTEEEYEHAVKVFNHHNCKTIEDYLILYLEIDVLHLSDVFETFRNTCLKHYKLDPLWFYTAPGLAWNAMLKKTKVNLELISDNSVLEFFRTADERRCFNRFPSLHRANNKYLPNYDPKKKTSYTEYLDANNLYGWAMSKPFPTGNFKFMSRRNMDKTFNQLINGNYSF